MERLQQLLEEGIIDEVFQQLKTGKEAEVWLVSHRGEPVAAKIYKAREFRSFKNDSGYQEGRQVRNTRTQRAMDKGSAFGREASEEAWKSAEADAMFTLHAAGVRVPKPVLFYEGVLLMEVIGDAEGRVAPRLVDAGLTAEQAGPMYLFLRGEVIKMLAADLIHGDLSEFNILAGVNGAVIIDFPQVVAAAKNSRAEQYFRRDLGNLVRFFSAIDPTLKKHETDIDEIWRAYVRRDLSPSFVPTGRAPPVARQGFEGRREGGGRGQGNFQAQGRGPNGRGPQQAQGAPVDPNRSGAGQGPRGQAFGPGQNGGARRGPGQPGAGPGQGQPRGAPQGAGQPGGGPRGQGQGAPQRGQPGAGPDQGQGQGAPQGFGQPGAPSTGRGQFHGSDRGPGGRGQGSRGPRDVDSAARSPRGPPGDAPRGQGRFGAPPRAPAQGGGDPRGPAGSGRPARGPEVSFKGGGSPPGGRPGGPGGRPSGAGRRRPPRRF